MSARPHKGANVLLGMMILMVRDESYWLIVSILVVVDVRLMIKDLNGGHG